jgi:hypothetical protein
VAEKSIWDLPNEGNLFGFAKEGKAATNHQDDICLLFHLYLFFGLMGEYTWYMIFFFQM